MNEESSRRAFLGAVAADAMAAASAVEALADNQSARPDPPESPSEIVDARVHLKHGNAARVGVFTATAVVLILSIPIAAGDGGPLRVHPENLRYFTDGTKHPDGSFRAVLLTGLAHLAESD